MLGESGDREGREGERGHHGLDYDYDYDADDADSDDDGGGGAVAPTEAVGSDDATGGRGEDEHAWFRRI